MKQFLNDNRQGYDLEERTARFGERIIDLVKNIKKQDVNSHVIRQAVSASTSIGANYCEANAASSKRDFRNKIFICKKEANETKHWLRMLARTNPECKEEIRKLWKETHELYLIFQKITSTIDKKRSSFKI